MFTYIIISPFSLPYPHFQPSLTLTLLLLLVLYLPCSPSPPHHHITYLIKLIFLLYPSSFYSLFMSAYSSPYITSS